MPVTILPYTDKAIGADSSASHCQKVTLLGLNVIEAGSFLPRTPTNAVTFSYQPSLTGRMGVFAATSGNVTRSWILLLPEAGVPDRVMIAIPPAKGQAGDYYGKLNGGDPLSVPLIRDDIALINGMDPVTMDMRGGKAQFCYGSQILGSSRPMALLYPVRALLNGGGADPELGPFGDDGGVIAETIDGIAAATGGAFKTGIVEAFTHSNGIGTLNAFLGALSGRRRIRNAFAIDPARAQSIGKGLADSVMQHLSGQTGGIVNGRPTGNFEFWPLDRWKNDPDRAESMRRLHNDLFDYLHNNALPRYLLRLSLQMSMN
jgi:hypothetical protein